MDGGGHEITLLDKEPNYSFFTKPCPGVFFRVWHTSTNTSTINTCIYIRTFINTSVYSGSESRCVSHVHLFLFLTCTVNRSVHVEKNKVNVYTSRELFLRALYNTCFQSLEYLSLSICDWKTCVKSAWKEFSRSERSHSLSRTLNSLLIWI